MTGRINPEFKLRKAIEDIVGTPEIRGITQGSQYYKNSPDNLENST